MYATLRYPTALFVGLAIMAIFSSSPSFAKESLSGVAITPAHFPKSTQQEWEQAFKLASQLGSHDTIIVDWQDDIAPVSIQERMNVTQKLGLKTHLYLSPISLDKDRKHPAIPRHIQGRSFRDMDVRDAFKEKALSYAALRPDYLGLGTEVNFLAQSPDEFSHYVSLAHETYQLIKAKYPKQTITISFQWDVMIISKGFGPLIVLKDCLDIYSFTTYPSFAKTADNLPADYYSSIRKILPNERIGFSEIGWSTVGDSNEEEQAKYVASLPKLMKSTRSEYYTWALLHDVQVFRNGLDSLNYVGLFRQDGSMKPAWNKMKALEW